MPDISNSSGAATEEMMQPCLIYLHGISLLPFRTTHICRVSFCPRTSRCTPVPARSRPVFAPALQTVPATVLTLLNPSWGSTQTVSAPVCSSCSVSAFRCGSTASATDCPAPKSRRSTSVGHTAAATASYRYRKRAFGDAESDRSRLERGPGHRPPAPDCPAPKSRRSTSVGHTAAAAASYRADARHVLALVHGAAAHACVTEHLT